MKVTTGFQMFMEESGEVGKAYSQLVQTMAQNSALDKKTHALAYISALAAAQMTGGLAFHVMMAKKVGASRDEVRDAVLVGLPAVGLGVLDALEVALNAYDETETA